MKVIIFIGNKGVAEYGSKGCWVSILRKRLKIFEVYFLFVYVI